ncbi:hypothetical protein CYMTET_3035 [Cymbomonas tetramitiformis]|uniref:Uncharacterized protein n=1 Tax=Cymbomonas tetramitiformis TaxID=36881 RepID=A0AAE0H419_9CHLO|nr:hypothetical protein CYMTET_3035 [Cymbomonas tetramitiformis]
MAHAGSGRARQLASGVGTDEGAHGGASVAQGAPPSGAGIDAGSTEARRGKAPCSGAGIDAGSTEALGPMEALGGGCAPWASGAGDRRTCYGGSRVTAARERRGDRRSGPREVRAGQGTRSGGIDAVAHGGSLVGGQQSKLAAGRGTDARPTEAPGANFAKRGGGTDVWPTEASANTQPPASAGIDAGLGLRLRAGKAAAERRGEWAQWSTEAPAGQPRERRGDRPRGGPTEALGGGSKQLAEPGGD